MLHADAENRARGMALATLCDMVIGENAEDRSDVALIRAVGKIQRGEFICSKCGLRKDSDFVKGDF